MKKLVLFIQMNVLILGSIYLFIAYMFWNLSWFGHIEKWAPENRFFFAIIITVVESWLWTLIFSKEIPPHTENE